MKSLLAFIVPLFLIQMAKADGHRGKGDGEAGVMMRGSHDTAASFLPKPVSSGLYRNNIYKKRLDSIQQDVQLDFNEDVQSYIDGYLAQREEISRELGLAKYYFPIYEKAFRDAGIPDEIKYLSIVESQLNPNAVSRVGATGPWQFMGTTARMYGLNMDNYVDERRDPVLSSAAAAAYLKDAYVQFGDWLLAIASYNCGKSNVMDAIEKAGGATDYWSIRQYLPVETRGYVPAYIAITYVMKYHKKYHITVEESNLSMLKTDTVAVDKFISLNSVSRVLGVSISQLSNLNPSYTQAIVNGSAAAPKMLVIPQSFKEKYKMLYSNLNTELGSADVPEYGLSDGVQPVEKRIPVHHRVRKYESLASVVKAHSKSSTAL
ncbi:MAG: lytic transglycosylase domain-containing protein [Sphingobacteriales bacterium]